MRVILEQGDKPEVKELVRQLQKLVPGIVIIEDKTQQEHRLLSDDEIREAILSVMPFFSVRSQWVAVYRILVDYYGFPEEVTAFCNRISKLMRGSTISRFRSRWQRMASCRNLTASGRCFVPRRATGFSHVRK